MFIVRKCHCFLVSFCTSHIWVEILCSYLVNEEFYDSLMWVTEVWEANSPRRQPYATLPTHQETLWQSPAACYTGIVSMAWQNCKRGWWEYRVSPKDTHFDPCSVHVIAMIVKPFHWNYLLVIKRHTSLMTFLYIMTNYMFQPNTWPSTSLRMAMCFAETCRRSLYI